LEGLGVNINLVAVLPNGSSYPDSKGDTRVFTYLGRRYTTKLQSTTKLINRDTVQVSAFYLGVEASKIRRTPKVPIKYMTLEPADMYEFIIKTMPQLHTLDYIPYLRPGSQFGNYGWTFYTVLDHFRYYLDVSEIVTNIPDFYIKALNVEDTYYSALRDFFADFKPKVYLRGDRLFIINPNGSRKVYYAGASRSAWQNTLTITSVDNVNINESDIPKPQIVSVAGGEVAFDKYLYKGPRSLTEVLQMYPILLQNPRVVNIDGQLTDVRYLNSLPVYGLAYSYGEPFRFVSVEDSFELLNFDDLPEIQKNAVTAIIPAGSTPNEYIFTSTLRRVKEEIYVRNFFNEQGPKIYDATYEFYKDFSARKEQLVVVGLGEEESEGEGEGGEESTVKTKQLVYKVSFSIGTGTLKQFTETFFNYGATTDVKFASPVLSSTIVMFDAATNTYKAVVSTFPSEMTTHFAYMPTRPYDPTGSMLMFMPAEVALRYHRHSPTNTDRYIRGDLMEEVEVKYGLAYGLSSSPGKRFKLAENELQFKMEEGFYFPLELSDFDRTLDEKCSARFLMREECLLEVKRTAYSRSGYNQINKATKVSSLMDALGVPTFTYAQETAPGQLPNSRHVFRGMEYEAIYDGTDPEQSILEEPVFKQTFKQLNSIPDINMALDLVRSSIYDKPVDVTVTFKTEMPIDVGWRVRFKNDAITVSKSDNSQYGETGGGGSSIAHQFPANTYFIVTQVSTNKISDDVTTTVSLEML
jgi:hypothetical protein